MTQRGHGTKRREAAEPEDLSIKRRLAEFFLRSKQIEEAKKCLEGDTEAGWWCQERRSSPGLIGRLPGTRQRS